MILCCCFLHWLQNDSSSGVGIVLNRVKMQYTTQQDFDATRNLSGQLTFVQASPSLASKLLPSTTEVMRLLQCICVQGNSGSVERFASDFQGGRSVCHFENESVLSTCTRSVGQILYTANVCLYCRTSRAAKFRTITLPGVEKIFRGWLPHQTSGL